LLVLVLKLVLAPALVATATRVARRLGHRAGGLVGGLPVVAAPIVLKWGLHLGALTGDRRVLSGCDSPCDVLSRSGARSFPVPSIVLLTPPSQGPVRSATGPPKGTYVETPPVLIYAVEQGDAFARDAAVAGALGLVSLVFFCLAYAACARVAGYVAALIAGWLAFGVATALLSVVNPPLGVSVILALGAIGGGSWVLARATTGPLQASEISDLLLWRLAITAALVIAHRRRSRALRPPRRAACALPDHHRGARGLHPRARRS